MPENVSPSELLSFFQGRDECRCKVIKLKFGEEICNYLLRYADLADPGTEILATSNILNLELINMESLHTIINLKRVNDIYELNRFFSQVNRVLLDKGYYIGCVETLGARRRRILAKYPFLIRHMVYGLDFTVKRIFPKTKPTRKIYRLLTRDINKVMSLTETLGRLTASGFKVIDYQEFDGLTFFICQKNKEPDDVPDKTYGFLIRLPRIGQNGKRFDVFKFRTMHPYAEYLQDFVFKNNHICSGGKFDNDFRVASWGRFMRKYWIDEQPMWINWLRREMKMVGVRPLSEQYFSLYPEEFQKRRIKYKPGLIPPFYADNPKSLEEIIASESKYLDSYDKNAFLTDFRYFFRIVRNILFKKARSA